MAGEQDSTQQDFSSPFTRPRKINGVRSYGADDVSSLEDARALGQVGVNYGISAPGIDPEVVRKYQARGDQIVYGQALLDADGYLVRAAYTGTQDEIEQQMLKFSPSELADLARQLNRTGFYASGEPSQLILNQRGYTNADLVAMGNLMRFANSKGVIVQALFGSLANMSSVAGDGGTKVKVTSEDDIKYYLDQAALSKLERKLSKADVDAAVTVIQNNERKMAAASRQSPSVSVAANIAAQKASPAEAAAYQLGNAISLAFQTLGGV
jgi:nucleotide-binding universal stress UspA family protein